jgi:hypothetical protein
MLCLRNQVERTFVIRIVLQLTITLLARAPYSQNRSAYLSSPEKWRRACCARNDRYAKYSC